MCQGRIKIFGKNIGIRGDVWFLESVWTETFEKMEIYVFYETCVYYAGWPLASSFILPSVTMGTMTRIGSIFNSDQNFLREI